MKLVFDDQALADLEDIFNWIAQDSLPPRRPWSSGFSAARSC
jgi:plasmid stabilization system protein ParE